jgi:hypothetical protein
VRKWNNAAVLCVNQTQIPTMGLLFAKIWSLFGNEGLFFVRNLQLWSLPIPFHYINTPSDLNPTRLLLDRLATCFRDILEQITPNVFYVFVRRLSMALEYKFVSLPLLFVRKAIIEPLISFILAVYIWNMLVTFARHYTFYFSYLKSNKQLQIYTLGAIIFGVID